MRSWIFAATLIAGSLGLASPASAAEAPATITVTLPADATLTIDDQPTESTSAVRTFTTPPLETGHRYYYVLKARYLRNGKTITIEKKVRVRPGRRSVVTLEPAGSSYYHRQLGYYVPSEPAAPSVVDPAVPTLEDDDDFYQDAG